MTNDYKEWLDAVIKNVASILSCSIEEATNLVDETNEAESLYETNTMVSLASHELVIAIRKANCKVQVRGTFTLSEYIFKQKVSPFCIDLNISEYEINQLLEKGRQKHHDIQATKIVNDKIVSLDLGYPDGSILILTLEFWATEGAGWYQISYSNK